MSGWNQWLVAPFTLVGNLPRALAGLSLAARIAVLVGVFQVVVVLLAIGVLLIGDEQQVFQAWWRPGKLAVLAVLLVLTPVLVHQAARLWLERDASRWPDILDAWQAALLELQHQGISLPDVPLFLVLGASSDDEEKRLLAEVPCELVVKAAPAGAAALHVYGGPDAVFVCLANSCQVSELVRRGGERRNAAQQSAVPQALAAAGGRDDVRGTVAVSTAADPTPTELIAAGEAAAPVAVLPEDQLHGTIQIDTIGSDSTAAAAITAVRQAAPTSADREAMAQRLQYVCELIRRERGGLAPFNGTLALIPWTLVQRGAGDALAIGRALGEDLGVLNKGMGLRAPVTALVVGMEQEPGFVELIRRMPAVEHKSRLGQRFPLGMAANYEQLGTAAARACGMIEDLVMGRIMRSKGVLSETGNRHLVSLVSRLRHELSGRLAAILRRAFIAADGESSDTAPFFSGCYLAACGTGTGGRAFVRGVLEKLLDAQGELEWTPHAESDDQRTGRAARILWIASGLIFVGIAAGMAWRLWQK